MPSSSANVYILGVRVIPPSHRTHVLGLVLQCAVPSCAVLNFAMQISEASKALSKAMRRSGGADRFQEMYAEGLLRQKHRAAAVR